jgi:Protein of unknown function (DUF2510)
MQDESALVGGPDQRLGARLAPAWWYPDPAQRHDLRYWTGETWSEFVIDGPTRTPSVDPLSIDPLSSANQGTAVAAATRVDSLQEATAAAAARADSVQAAVAEPVVALDGASASTEIPPPSRLRSRLMLAALVVVLVLIAVAGAYLVLGSS